MAANAKQNESILPSISYLPFSVSGISPQHGTMPLFTTSLLIKERRLLLPESSMPIGLGTFLVENGSLLLSKQFLPVARGMFLKILESLLAVQASFLP